jgi:hypothetical protein
LKSIKLNNGLASAQYTGDIWIVDCFNLDKICADEDEVDYFNQRLIEMNLNSQIQVLTECNLGVQDFNQNHIVLYPNPVSLILNIEADDIAIKSISIYTTLGQLVLSLTDGTSAVDVSRLTSGTYFVKMVSDKGIYNAKFIKD